MDELGVNIAGLAGFLGVAPHTLVLSLFAIMTACNITGRLIPDNAQGWRGGVRMVCKVVGLYVQNRVIPGVTVSELALGATETAHSASRTAQAVSRAMNFPPADSESPEPIEIAGRNAFANREEGFIDAKLLAILMIPLTVILLITSACATIPTVASTVCSDREAAQKLLDSVASDRTSAQAQKVFAFLQLTCPLVFNQGAGHAPR